MCYGAIRNLIEIGNNLQILGNNVTVYTENGFKCDWMYCRFKTKSFKEIQPCDALIIMDYPYDKNLELLVNTKANFKSFVMMGSENFSIKNCRSNLKFIVQNYTILFDGEYQESVLKENGIKTGVAIGGINLDQFRDLGLKRSIRFSANGDTRARKGFAEIPIKTETYFKKYDQWGIVQLLNDSVFFIDNHHRGGFNNPVLEAMACGCQVICKQNQVTYFANESNATIFKNIKDLGEVQYDPSKIENAKELVKKYDYKIVTKRFNDYLQRTA